MRPALSVALTALCLGGAATDLPAQSGRPGQAHNPLSMVDESDLVGVFGPPSYPAAPGNLGAPNHNLYGGSLILGDGWPENFWYVEPIPAPTQLVPLVVMFHKFGSTQNDLIANTNFAEEAGHQGWYLVCPLAANTQHYGSLPSQVHMEAVILDMLARYPLIDRNRIYALGFSMGAGAVANYAARHVDPAKPMIAAMVAMSGGFALKHTYYADPPTHQFLDFWFGNNTPGSADPWLMARSSTVNFDPITFQIEVGQDLARNITHIPLQLVRATDELIGYLPTQCDIMAAHMQTLGMVPGPNFGYHRVPFGWDAADHRWSMLDSRWAFDWMGTQTLTLPTSASTLADRDDIYFHFFVEQDAPDAFTPFTWNLDAASNTLQLSATANMLRLTVDTLGAGLNPGLPLMVHMSTADGLADQVVFTSVPAAPSGVSRDGNASVSWIYNASLQELTLIEIDGNPHVWSVVP